MTFVPLAVNLYQILRLFSSSSSDQLLTEAPLAIWRFTHTHTWPIQHRKKSGILVIIPPVNSGQTCLRIWTGFPGFPQALLVSQNCPCFIDFLEVFLVFPKILSFFPQIFQTCLSIYQPGWPLAFRTFRFGFRTNFHIQNAKYKRVASQLALQEIIYQLWSFLKNSLSLERAQNQ